MACSHYGKFNGHHCGGSDQSQWGCYEEASRPRYYICPYCFGASCDRCDGGEIKMTYCPNAENTGTMNEFYTAWQWFEDYKVFPNGGGSCDQNALFFDVVSFMRHIKNKLEVQRTKK